MRIGASPIQTYANGSVQSQERLRQEQSQQAVLDQDKARQKDPQQTRVDQDVQISDAARRVAEQREVVATDKPVRPQRQYQYYPFPNTSSLSTSQQKALQTYSSNQSLSRVDNSGDFLGSVDVFA